LIDVKSVRRTARGHNIAMPTEEMIRLMLKALESAEYFLTKTTDKPEATAESKAKAVPIMPFLECVEVLKQTFQIMGL
jgi:hypothetical protein